MNADGSMDEADWTRLRREVTARNKARQQARDNPVSARLKRRLEEFYGASCSTPVRVRAGHWQRSSGAWSWEATVQLKGGGVLSVGSLYSMSECLRMKDKEFGDSLS